MKIEKNSMGLWEEDGITLMDCPKCKLLEKINEDCIMCHGKGVIDPYDFQP